MALAFADHLASFIYCSRYEESARYWLYKVGSNPFRWVEYSVSASTMAVAISILCGISDVHLWFLILIMHGVGMFFGLIMELLPKVEDSNFISFDIIRKICFWCGTVSIFTPWLVMCCYFFKAMNSSVPDFVYAAFLGTLFLFTLFGINAYLHNILKWYNFSTAEIVYITLSFTAKTFLAADVFGGLKSTGSDD